ncbi:hypothetical protein J6590_106834, partial [Homalodisca vitripennis]
QINGYPLNGSRRVNSKMSQVMRHLRMLQDGSGVYKLTNVDSTLLARLLWWERVLDKLQIISHSSPQLSLDVSH